MRLTLEISGDAELTKILERAMEIARQRGSTPHSSAMLDAANAELDELPLLLRAARKAANEAVRLKFTLTTPQMNTLMRTRHTRGNYVADKLVEEYRTQFAEQKAADQKETEVRLLELTKRKREVMEARKALTKKRKSDTVMDVLREMLIIGDKALQDKASAAKGGKR